MKCRYLAQALRLYPEASIQIELQSHANLHNQRECARTITLSPRVIR